LILGAGGNTLRGWSGRKLFWFLLAWKMKRNSFEVVAISTEAAPREQRKVLPPNGFSKSAYRFVGVRPGVLKYELLFRC